jgi:hypothetical protein
VWRFNFFKEYANKLIQKSQQPQSNSASNQSQQNPLTQPQSNSTGNQSQQNPLTQPQSNSANSQKINRQNSKNCPRYSGDGSALYPPIYYESDLDKFILWYVENFKLLNKCNKSNNSNNPNKEIHIVVVCHSHIIQAFVKDRMTIEQLNNKLQEKDKNITITDYDDYFKKYFNYCISVNVEYNTSQNTNKEIISKYNKNYNKSLDLLQGSKYSNTITTGNKLKKSEDIMKKIVPVCGFGNICVRKISIGYIGSNKESHSNITSSPICKFSKNENFTSNKILSGINSSDISSK